MVIIKGNGRFQLALLLTTGTALLGVVIEGLNMAFVLPAAKCELDITTGEQGMINAVAFLGVVLTSHFWGFMADTWGRRKVLQFALGTGFLFSALSSMSVSSTMLLVTRFCVGLTCVYSGWLPHCWHSKPNDSLTASPACRRPPFPTWASSTATRTVPGMSRSPPCS